MARVHEHEQNWALGVEINPEQEVLDVWIETTSLAIRTFATRSEPGKAEQNNSTLCILG